MRSTIFFYGVFLSFCSCKSQTFSKQPKKQKREYAKETIAFIKYIRAIEYPNDTILLADKPNMKGFNDCMSILFRDSTLFTKEEQETINTQINDPQLKKWNLKLVDKAEIISSDTITSIFKDRNKWWNYFHQHYGENFNSFSAPIFLRNNTLCLFYSDHSCGGLCGGGQITLFKKEGGSWKPFRSFCEWIS